MNNNKLQLRSEVTSTISLAEITESRDSLKALTRRMAVELSIKLNRRLRDFGTFEGQEAVAWLCIHCRQNNIPPGLWAQSPSNSLFARTTHFLRGKNGPRSQSMDMSQLHISPPSPTTQSVSPRLSVSFFPKLKSTSPHNKRKSLPASATLRSEETSPHHASSFFGKLKSSDHSPTPPLHPFPPSLSSLPSTASPSSDTPTSTSFFSKLKSLGRPPIARIHSTGDLQNDTTPTNSQPTPTQRRPKAFDFAVADSHKSSPQKQPPAASITTTITTSRGSFSVVNSTSTSSEISPNKKFGPVLAVPSSPHTPRSSSSSRKQQQLRNSSVSFSSFSEVSSRQSFSEEGGRSVVAEDPLLKKTRKRGSSEEAQIAINLNEAGIRHAKKLSDESKKVPDENNNNNNNNNGNNNANTHTNPKLLTGKHTHKLSEDKSPRRTSDENVPDRNVAVRVWRAALQMGFIQSVKAKKFTDNHALFRFGLAELGLEDESKDQSNSLTDTRFSTSARASYSSGIASSDPTPTSFESMPSSESSSHMESVLSFNSPRGSSYIPGEEVDMSVDQRRWSTAAPPPSLFDYSQLKHFSWPLRADAYSPFARIGSGGFGDVFSACCSTPQGARLVAVKVMDLEKVDHALPWLMQESKVMAQLSHPNLTQIFCSFVSETSVWLVMPLAHGGSCLQIMQANHLKGFSNLGIISYIMSNVVSGLTYLHSHGLLHRDIKADNILISHEGHVLLADFGCAGVVHEEKSDERDLLTVPAGTRDFMSPEMVHGIGYDERTDIWSLGITAMELFMGSTPSNLREAEAALDPPQPLDLSNGRPSRSRSISSRSPSSRSSDHLVILDGHYQHTRAMRRRCRDNMALFREFVDLCLSRNAVSRPLARDLLQHPFLQHPENGQEELVRLVKSVRPATALIPNEDLPPFLNRLHRPGRRAMSVPPAPRKSPSGRNLSLHHKKNSSRDDTDFIYVFR